jgi:DNA-binding transcriptional MocR family regulator
VSPAQAFRILRLAETYDFIVVEDDVYGDLCPPSYPATRLASLDQLKRVIYLGSFSKTLTSNLRVGFAACSPDVANALADQKLLVGMTTPELNERLLYKVLTEGHYRRHIERLRARLDGVRHVLVGRHGRRRGRVRRRRPRGRLPARARQPFLAEPVADGLDAL